MFRRHIEIVRGWSNILPCFLIAAFFVPAFYSVAPYLSWVGAHRQEYTSVITISASAVLFYLLANLMQDRMQHKRVHLTLLVSTSIAVFIAFLEFFHVSILSSVVPSLTLNTLGTLSSFTTYLIVFSSFFLASSLVHTKTDVFLHSGWLGVLEQVLVYLISAAAFFFCLVLDDALLWVLFSLSLLTICVFVLFRAKDFSHHAKLSWPIILLVGAFLFWFFLPGINSNSIPLEVTLNSASSQSIAEQSLEMYSQAWGSGPGTYAINYSQFHSPSLNQTTFWNVRFDRASNFFLTLKPTIGLAGISFLGLFVMLLFIRSLKQLLKPASSEQWRETFMHLVPWISLVISAFLISWNVTLVFSFALFSGLLASQTMHKKWSWTFSKTPSLTLFMSALFVTMSFVFFVGIFFVSERYAAEIAFAQAVDLDRKGESLHEVVTLLDRAAMLNTYHDTYYRNLGEALLLRVNEELSDIDSLDALTDESAQYVQALTAASVNAVAHATYLSPKNVLNWLSRGFVYRELASVIGQASQFSVESYKKAVELEPTNPSNWTELGRAYVIAAEQQRPLTISQDEQIAQLAQDQFSQLLLSAQQAIETSIELKPDYAPAHFELALVFERQGRLDDAVGKMESVAQYNQLDVGVHFQLAMLYIQRGGEGDLERAKNTFEHVVKLAPTYANAHWFLASIYEMEGDISAAVSELEIVLGLNPDNELVQAKLNRLVTGQISNTFPEALEEK